MELERLRDVYKGICRTCRSSKDVLIELDKKESGDQSVRDLCSKLTGQNLKPINTVMFSLILPSKICIRCYNKLVEFREFCEQFESSCHQFSQEYRNCQVESTENELTLVLGEKFRRISDCSNVKREFSSTPTEFRERKGSAITLDPKAIVDLSDSHLLNCMPEKEENILIVVAQKEANPPAKEPVIDLGSTTTSPATQKESSTTPNAIHSSTSSDEPIGKKVHRRELYARKEREETQWNCKHCKRIFLSREDLQGHIIRAHNEGEAKCELCSSVLGSFQLLAAHIFENHLNSSKGEENSTPKQKVATTEKFKIKILSRRRDSMGTYGRDYSHRDAKRVRRNSGSDENNVYCRICDRMMSTPAGLKAHITKVHSTR